MCSPEGDTDTQAQKNRISRRKHSAFQQAKVTTELLAWRARVWGFHHEERCQEEQGCIRVSIKCGLSLSFSTKSI